MFTLDLEQQTIVSDRLDCQFAIAAVSRNPLLNGWDDIDLTESLAAEIAAFKAKGRQLMPWAMPQAR